MSTNDVFAEDWGDVEQETKAASSKGGVFVQLKDDGDEVFVAFIQKAETKAETNERYGGTSMRTCANIAVFEDDTFAGVKLLKLAPTHWALFLEYRRECGGDSIFKIRRRGGAGSKDTKYAIFNTRKMSEPEKKIALEAELLPLWEPRPAEDNDGYPGSYIPEALSWEAFNKAISVELARLRWDKQMYIAANKNFLQGNYKDFNGMTEREREDIVKALRAAPVGITVGEFSVGDGLDLTADEDFF